MTARDAATEADPSADAAADDAVDGPDTEPTAEAGTTVADASDDAATDDAAADEAGDDTARESGTSDAGSSRRGRRGRRRTTAGSADGTDDGTPSRRRAPSRRARWVVTTLLVVSALFAGAMVTVYVVSRPDPIAGLSSSQQSAVDAATQAAINLQTFRRASFDQDFANALASLTPQFAQEQLAPRKDALKQQLDTGGRDASATALSAGLVSSTSSQAVVLVVTTTTQTADDGTSTPFVFSRLQLTLQRVDGKWLVSDLQSVGLS